MDVKSTDHDKKSVKVCGLYVFIFENMKILSGREGLDRIVKRAFVFDAPFQEDVLEKDVLVLGDFFITFLLQFHPGSEELMQVLQLLVKGNCSGLCVMMEELAHEANEYLSIESFRQMTEIYAKGMYKLMAEYR